MADEWLEKLPGIRDVIDDTGGGMVTQPRASAIILRGAVDVDPTPDGLVLDFTGGGGGGGGGDVTGPATVVNNRLAAWDGTSGNLLKDSGVATADVVQRGGGVAFTADQSMGGNKLTSLGNGTASTDAVNKSQLDAVAAAASGKYGFQYTFSATTTDADPGAGLLRFNNATIGSVTQIYVDLTDVDGNNLTNWLAALDDAIGTVKGFVYVRSISDDTKWGMWRLDSITSPGGYVKLNCTYITGGAGGLPTTTAGDTLLQFEAWGNGAAAGNGLSGTATHTVQPHGTTLTVSASGVKLRDGTAAGQELFWDGAAWQLLARTTAALGDASVTIQFTTAAQHIWPAGTNTTAIRTITLGTTGLSSAPFAGRGAIINLIFLRAAGYAHNIVFANGGVGGGTIGTLPAGTAYAVMVSCYYDGTNWDLAGWEPINVNAA